MIVRNSVLVLSSVVLAVALACSTSLDVSSDASEWVGTIAAEGGVTTVVNQSGAMWPANARLIEEASIGVESGANEYLLGHIQAVYGTDDHIYVIDQQLNLVRRYDENGVFADQIGRIGQGPGEYTEPGMIEVARDGRIFVWDPRARRVAVFGPDGTPLATWPATGAFCCVYPMYFEPGHGETDGAGTSDTDAGGGEIASGEADTAQTGGALWMLTYSFDRETLEEIFGLQAFGPEGRFGPIHRRRDLEVASERLSAGGRSIAMPFAPGLSSNTAGAERFLAGVPDTYRFEVQYRGETVLVVEKYWEPVPIDPEHAEWQRRATIANVRRRDPGWTWDGAGMPGHHPAYETLLGTATGEVWVLRNAPSVRVEDCVEDPLADDGAWESTPASGRLCWRNVYIVDVFDAEGRFLGEVETPPGFSWSAYSLRGLARHIDGDRVVVAVEDETGVIRVKRYRLVLPG